MENLYLTVEQFELGKCSNCGVELSIAGVPLIHVALCQDCERMILSYEDEYGKNLVDFELR